MSAIAHATDTDHVAWTVRQLQQSHPDDDPALVAALVQAEFLIHRDDRVRNFIPILVTRAVDARLRGHAPDRS